MLEQLSVLSPDPILGLAAECRADPNPNKIDLTVGIYMDEAGVCPVFQAVREAQRQLVADEITKAYLPAAGDAVYLQAMKSLVFGDELAGDGSNITAIQTPGGVVRFESLQRYWPLRLLTRLFGSATLPGLSISR